jgi:soluble P-type ATPase
MISASIPGFGDIQIEHAVFDYNGTLAVDGILLPGVREKIDTLSSHLRIHVVTADTFGTAEKELHDLSCQLSVLSQDTQDIAKRDYVVALNPKCCVCVGNGRNDREMLRIAMIGIALVQAEGASAESIAVANVVCANVIDAIDLLLNPKRLAATLRC